MSVAVRLFAAAAEAAGTSAASFDDVPTAGALRAALLGRLPAQHGTDGGELARVLGRCSLLADGVRLADDDATVPDGATVDVLPPFAGG